MKPKSTTACCRSTLNHFLAMQFLPHDLSRGWGDNLMHGNWFKQDLPSVNFYLNNRGVAIRKRRVEPLLNKVFLLSHTNPWAPRIY